MRFLNLFRWFNVTLFIYINYSHITVVNTVGISYLALWTSLVVEGKESACSVIQS